MRKAIKKGCEELLPQQKNFIALLKAAVVPGSVPVLEDPNWADILSLAASHAVTALLYPPLKRFLPPTDPILMSLKKQSFSAATRSGLQNAELSKIFDACEREQISILPLKGCVLKDLYPYPELRFMSDADLLIDRKNEKSMRALLESQGFCFHKVDAGDTDVYISPIGLNYEIHKSLEDEGYNSQTRAFSKSLLSASGSKAPYRYIRSLPAETHYIYVLIHFIKHFIYGGIGVRQFTDLYIFRKEQNLDEDKLREGLEDLGLSQFHQKLQNLCHYWFEDGTADPITEELSDYILSSGVFGTEENRSTDRILSNRQRGNYFIARLFPTYGTMCGYFPILRKIPILLPFMWLWRMIRATLFRRKKLLRELDSLSSNDEDILARRAKFYQNCGLSVYDKP